ncbi:MAG: alanine racemase [Flavobacteriaceae bacterium]
MSNWYDIEDIQEIDSPSLVLYKEHLEFNLDAMLKMVNNKPKKLIPHIKTNKMPEVLSKYVNLGIKAFKSSTISEAEIAAKAGAESVLIAHQLVGPKIERFCNLIKTFPKTEFYTIVDNSISTEILNQTAIKHNLQIGTYIDVNNGMNRSGIKPREL